MAYRDYSQVSNQPVSLLRKFLLPAPYELLNSNELDQLFADSTKGIAPAWDRFFRKYPGSLGLWTFSRIGFNAPRTKAVVSVRFGCGELCALNTDYLLEKTAGHWRLVPIESACGGVA